MARAVATQHLTVDLRRQGPAISPLLFGHNLEHTRSCVWQGLSAQLVANRKLCGKPQRSGVALDWYGIGGPRTFFALGAPAFTSHYDAQQRRYNEISSQRVHSATRGAIGIGQAGIPLRQGTRYECRLAVQVDRSQEVTVRLCRRRGGGELAAQALHVEPGEWREAVVDLVPAAASDGGCLEVTVSAPGTLLVGSASLLPAGHFLGLRADVVALLAEVGCTVLRWPGGNFAGDYRWQDGLLPVDRRAPLAARMEMETLPHTRGCDTHEIGTDEFIALCRCLGAQPFVTINPAWESAEVSAAWVEYCNGAPDTPWGRVRAERGHPEPYGVRYWSLGNELGYGHMEGPNLPAEYAAACRPYAAAMRAVDPTIELVSSGAWYGEAWFGECLPVLGPSINHISYHHYTQDAPAAFAPGLDAGAARAFEAVVCDPTTRLAADLRRVRARLDAVTGSDRALGISFDEWNVWYAWYRRPGMLEAAHAGSLLHLLCREAESLGITIGCHFQPVNEGAIEVEPHRAVLTPVGRAMRLLRAHAGSALLGLDAPAAVAAGAAGTAPVDALASLDSRRGCVTLTLVNRSATHGWRVVLRLSGAAAVHGAEGVLLGAAHLGPGAPATERPLRVRLAGERLSLRLAARSLARVRIFVDWRGVAPACEAPRG